MRIARIAAYLGCLGIGWVGPLAGAGASEPARSALPRPPEAVPAVEAPRLPDGVAAPELADALRELATATRGSARPGSAQYRRAVDLLEVAVAGDPASAAAKVPLADAYVDSGNPLAVVLAGELYAEALVDYPRADALLARVADAGLVLGHDERALAYAARRLAADQGPTPAAAAQLALIALETGHLRHAAAELQRAARETQDRSVARLGRLLTQAVADSDRAGEAQRPAAGPAAAQEFHDQRLAAMSDPLLSSAARLEMVRAALRAFLAPEPPATLRDARPRHAAVRPTGRAFVAIQEHRQRLIGLEAASEGEPSDDAGAHQQALKLRIWTGSSRIRENSEAAVVAGPAEPPPNSHEFGYAQLQSQQAAGALKACVAAAELTESQLRYLHRCLGLTCSVEELVAVWAGVQRAGVQRAGTAGDDDQEDGGDAAARIALWRPLVDVCQWAALQQDWRQVRFALQVLRELAAHPTPVPQLVDTVRAETAEAVAAMKMAWAASREAERELLMNRRNAWRYRAEELQRGGTTAEAEAAEAQVAEIQQAVRRFQTQVDLNIVLALLCQSAGPAAPSDEPGLVGSGMLLQFKTDVATDTLRPGAAVWFDRAVALDSWFNADQHAESLAESSAGDPERPRHATAGQPLPAARLSLPTLVSVVTAAVACFEPEDADGESAGRAPLLVVSEVERLRAEGTGEAEMRQWLIEHLHQLCRESFRGSAEDAAPTEDGAGQRRTDL